jgi:hypothetical protein
MSLSNYQLPVRNRSASSDGKIGIGTADKAGLCCAGMRIQTVIAVILAGIVAGCAARRDRKAEYLDAFKKPLLSPGAQFGALPPAVQNTVIAEAGSEVIWDVVKDNSSGQTVYKIYFENRDLYPPLLVARDGSVLNPDLTVAVKAPEQTASSLGINTGTMVKLTDLPQKVLDVIHEQGSRTDISEIDKATWGNRTVYIITFRDESHYPKLYVEADGTLLKDVK